MWGGGGLKINSEDFSVLKKYFLTCLILSGKDLCDILSLVLQYKFKKCTPL